MLNRNRCILCTRCVRFMKEIDTDAQINITDRGYGSEIATFQEEGVHSLLSGNLMDVCPVGAITTRDYRFKSRPWDNPDAVDTICTFCEKGCNTTRVAQGEAGMGEGRAAGAHDAALQPRRSTTTGCATSAASTITGSKGTIACAARWSRDDRRRAAAGRTCARRSRRSPTASTPAAARGALRFLVSAHASIEELFLLGRLGGAFGLPEDGVAISWRDPREAAAAGRRSSRFRRSTRRTSRARTDLGFPVEGDRERRAGPRGVPPAGRERRASRRSSSSIPARPARSATSRG